MTLYEFVNDTAVQGAIRVSAWKGDEETVLFETDGTDDFHTGDLADAWEDCEVLYVFCAGNVLHIEVDADGIREEVEYEEAPYKVVIRASAVKHDFAEFDTAEEAEDFCEYYDRRWIDENGFEWSLEIEEA